MGALLQERKFSSLPGCWVFLFRKHVEKFFEMLSQHVMIQCCGFAVCFAEHSITLTDLVC